MPNDISVVSTRKVTREMLTRDDIRQVNAWFAQRNKLVAKEDNPKTPSKDVRLARDARLLIDRLLEAKGVSPHGK